MLRSALPPGRAAHAVCSCAAALPKPRRGALSLCRFVDTTRHHVAVCVRVSAIAAVVSHRIARVAPPSAGHVPPAPLPHCLGSRWLCCACSGSRPARRAAFFIPGRTSGEARQRCAHATVRAATTATGLGAPAKGRGEPPRSIATPARADCANVRPRGGRTEGGTFAPARLRHMQGAKRRTPLAIRNIVRERTHRPARALRPILGFRRASASRPSSLAPRAAEPSADNDGPRAQTDSPRGHARLFSPTQSATRERAPAARSPRHRTRSAAPSLNAR